MVSDGKNSKGVEKAKRLSDALRRNLVRRKEQQKKEMTRKSEVRNNVQK